MCTEVFARWRVFLLCGVLFAFAGHGCKGGEIDYVRSDASGSAGSADGQGHVPLATVVTSPVAPEGYTTTSDQALQWKQKMKSGDTFNEVMIRHDVVQLPSKSVHQVKLADNQVSLPLAGNEALLALKPGAPLAGGRADAAARKSGDSNNVLGFMRKVKSVKQQDGQIVIETEPAHLEDFVVGAASLSFPKEVTPIDIGDEVDLYKIIPKLPPQMPMPNSAKNHKIHASHGNSKGIGTRNGALSQDINEKFGFGFDEEVHIDLLDLDEPFEYGNLSLTVEGTGNVDAVAALFVGAFLKVTIEETFLDPAPHMTYFYAGAGGKADFGVNIDVNAKISITASTESADEQGKDEDEAKKSLTEKPIEKKAGHKASKPGGKAEGGDDEFTLGKPKYYEGPTIWVIPTVFVLTLQGKCDFTIYGEIDATAAAEVAFDAIYAIEYKDGDWQTHQPDGFKKVFAWDLRSAGGGVELQCEIGPRIDWLFADVAGPFIEAKAGLKAGAEYKTVCPDPGTIAKPQKATGKVSAGIDVGVTATVGVAIDLVIWSTEWSADLADIWWTLWADSWGVSVGFGTCPSDCSNGIQDDFETGIDCGGQQAGGGCPGCAVGAQCQSNVDCDGGSVCAGGKCGFVNCQSGKQEDYETDVNCGGKCATAGFQCPSGKKCNKNEDCDSLNCDPFSKTCGIQQCNNGVRDWWEGGIDCGGKYCPACADGQTCKQDTDCMNGSKCQIFNDLTDGGFGVCLSTNCNMDQYFSGVWAQKGDMTDVMCGGVCAQIADLLTDKACTFGKDNLLSEKKCGRYAVKCETGKKCAQDGDCAADHCYNGQCIELKCSDGAVQEWETDADCGGLCAQKCALNKHCKIDGDCSGGMSCVDAGGGEGKFCALCNKNGKLDGYETDIDCGSQCASGKADFDLCLLGQGCMSALDCKTGYTANINGKNQYVDSASCQAGKCVLTCYNGQFDKNSETDVDCGGKCAAKCSQGKNCASANDCDAGACFAGKCQNGKKDSDEAGIDCGGVCGSKCLKGMQCGVDGDCSTGQCLKGICGFDACKDGVLSPGESDIDCGGNCEAKCINGNGCKADKECQSGFCDGLVCVGSSCTDKKQDAGESDVDCGGTCKDTKTCAIGAKCKSGSDCVGQLCSTNGKCVADKCLDGIKSGDETGVDCGGSCAAKCTYGQGCKSGVDCDSKYCDGTLCVGDFCSDKVLSPGESDLDCGGACSKKCLSGKLCNGGGDCQSGVCNISGNCASGPCADGKKSSGEADIDCGGLCATKCLAGKACNGGSDCASTICAAISLSCVVTTCQDEIKDGGETDIDCGGNCNGKCLINKGCSVNGDCQSTFCNGATCVATACEDKQLDVGETGVDCGGPCAVKCDLGIGCSVDKDCSSGFCDAIGGKCVDSQCKDNHLDKGETDVDCGGLCQGSKACELGKGCAIGADCNSAICSLSGKCVDTTCKDGKLTPDETGVDCGGSCAQKCGSGQGCKAGGDCDSSFCSAALLCVGGTCEDGKLSAGETDIDCGGSCSAKCLTGKGCLLEADCKSGFCDGSVCVASACQDKKADLGETDVDCGGPCSQKCALTKGCAVGGDCLGGVCGVKSLKCVASTCVDETLDGSESDVDCGGSCAVKCLTGKGCSSNGDCGSGYCDGQTCVSDPCVDKQKDQGESDIDCGNVCSVKCVNGKGCSAPTDCASTFCDGSACVATACLDKKADLGETDVDCGGPCDSKCALTKGCATGSDCASTYCAAISLACVASACQDEVKNAGETDIDCGGTCQKCTTGKGCAKNGDCASGYCDGSVCVADHCLDKQKDVGETGADCGGTCQTACDNGQGCSLPSDCTSTYCAAIALSCVGTPCQDEVKDGDETDMDCGGSVCAGKCAAGKGCKASGDCQSTFCNVGSGKCVTDHCSDGAKDADELGPDCGGSCLGCADGVACTNDSDCVSGTCNPMGSGKPKVCGCPAWTVPMQSTIGGQQKIQCVRNYIGTYSTDSCTPAPESSNILSCNNSGLQFLNYNWAGPANAAGALQFCDNMTEGGHDDWHLPTLGEMMTVVQFGNKDAIPGGFALTSGLTAPSPVSVRGLWTSSSISKSYQYIGSGVTYVPGSPYFFELDQSAIMGLVRGNANAPMQTLLGDSDTGFAYCVRFPYGTPSLPYPRFTIIANGQVVQDALTNKYWYRNKITYIDQASATAFCAGLSVPGINGQWHLPTVPEQMSIVDTTKQQPFWDTDLFGPVDPPSGGSSDYSGEGFVTSQHGNPSWLLPWADGTYPNPYAVFPWTGRIFYGGGVCSGASCAHNSALCVIP